MLNKSGPTNTAKRVATSIVAAPVLAQKAKEPPRPISVLPSSTSTGSGPSKLGPSTFRSATETTSVVTATAQTSTITLINPQAERRPLGPPSRPSAMAQSLRQSTAVSQLPNHNTASTVLLQSRIDEKALDVQSEDIVLPDIASE